MIVIDATVAIKILTREPGAEAALARISDEPDRLAPDWIRVEIANALSRKVRLYGLPEAAARAGLAGLDAVVTDQTATLDLLDRAFDLSIRLDHAVYDCVYLALAIETDAIVVTHDKDFATAARKGGFAERIELLA